MTITWAVDVYEIPETPAWKGPTGSWRRIEATSKDDAWFTCQELREQSRTAKVVMLDWSQYEELSAGEEVT